MIAKLEGHKVVCNKTRTKHRTPINNGGGGGNNKQWINNRTTALDAFYWYQIIRFRWEMVLHEILYQWYYKCFFYCFFYIKKQVSMIGKCHNLLLQYDYVRTKKQKFGTHVYLFILKRCVKSASTYLDIRLDNTYIKISEIRLRLETMSLRKKLKLPIWQM